MASCSFKTKVRTGAISAFCRQTKWQRHKPSPPLRQRINRISTGCGLYLEPAGIGRELYFYAERPDQVGTWIPPEFEGVPTGSGRLFVFCPESWNGDDRGYPRIP